MAYADRIEKDLSPIFRSLGLAIGPEERALALVEIARFICWHAAQLFMGLGEREESLTCSLVYVFASERVIVDLFLPEMSRRPDVAERAIRRLSIVAEAMEGREGDLRAAYNSELFWYCFCWESLEERLESLETQIRQRAVESENKGLQWLAKETKLIGAQLWEMAANTSTSDSTRDFCITALGLLDTCGVGVKLRRSLPNWARDSAAGILLDLADRCLGASNKAEPKGIPSGDENG